MNSNPEDLKNVGRIFQWYLISTREIIWKIRNFKSLPKAADYSLDSPTFDFLNATWCLRLYPRRAGTYMGFTIVRMCSHVPYREISCNFIWPDEYYGRHSWCCSLTENHKEAGFEYFVERSRPARYTSCINETKVLTLTCLISFVSSPVLVAFSQTEQDKKVADVGDLCQNFRNFLLNGQDHDLVLKVKDKEFRAHRNILRSRSLVLNHKIEKNSGLIDIPDCDPGAFEQFLLYLYTGKVETLDAGNMLGLYYIADKYYMGDYKEHCRQFIKNSLTSSNVSGVIELALNHSDSDLLECATDYFVDHVNVVLRTLEWQSFAKRNIIQANELCIKAAENWKAEKNSHSEYGKNGEDFNQIDLISTRNIYWFIPDFESMPKAIGYSLDSPPFDLGNATWCLRLYPYVQETHIGFTIVRLCSRVPRHRLRYNLVWFEEFHGNYSMEDDFDESHNENGDMWFLERSRCDKYKRELQLMCQISSYGSPTVDVFSQTEQDTKSTEALGQDFKNLLLNGQDHDLVLNVKDKKFRAHQNILRVRSPVLESMLNHDMLEKNSGVIDVPDCDPGAFEQFLLYLYSGEVETLDADNMLALYYIADKYDMGHLKEVCREFVKESLISSNVSDVIQLALNHSDADLLECATTYFVKHVKAVLRSVKWQSFVSHNPIQANELFIKAADKWDTET